MSDTEFDFSTAMEFAEAQVESEADEFAGELPMHSDRLVVSCAADLSQTVTNVKMRQASEVADDMDDEEIREAIKPNVVDLLMALGAVKYEYGLDVAAALEERVEFIEDFKTFESAMQDADSEQEMVEAIDEHMDDEIREQFDTTPQPGENVDADDYEPEDADKAFQ